VDLDFNDFRILQTSLPHWNLQNHKKKEKDAVVD
jgi:hypothetical protein